MISEQKIFLPKALRPYYSNNLIRLGSKYDGGYVVSNKNIHLSKFLISMGIDYNFDFELDFFKYTQKSVIMFDFTSTKISLLKSLIKDLIFLRFQELKNHFIGLIHHFFFLSKRDVELINKFVGYDIDNQISFKSVVSKFLRNKKKNHKGILKIDIEGSEYRILSDILSYQHLFLDIVIEFHDVDINLQKIIYFSSKLKKNIININVNNYGFILPNGLPKTIEITFSNDHINSQYKKYFSNILNAPCNPKGKVFHEIFFK